MHAEHLEAVHGVGPHTISVPRIKHADDIDPSAFDNSISERFCKICALIRISVPYTGMIISTRESQAVREKFFLWVFLRLVELQEPVSVDMISLKRKMRLHLLSLMSAISARLMRS